MDEVDPLTAFNGMAVCPACGCVDKKGIYRCPECGTFHAGSIMEEREAPPPNRDLDVEVEAVDPSIYSLGPGAEIPDEQFEESDDVRSWDGGSTDFTFDDADEPPIHLEKKSLPDPEEITDED